MPFGRMTTKQRPLGGAGIEKILGKDHLRTRDIGSKLHAETSERKVAESGQRGDEEFVVKIEWLGR